MMIDISAFERAPLQTDPFEFLIVKDFVPASEQDQVLAHYPAIEEPGSFPTSSLHVGARVQNLIDDLNGEAFRKAVEKKFDIDLSGSKTMFTLRGRCSNRDGQIHTDSKTKLITVLLYLNPPWAQEGGKLRILRNGHDLNDAVAEVPPNFGTLLAFRRSDRSWHGHEKFSGDRKVLQMNWVTNDKVAAWQIFRHSLSAFAKRGRRVLVGQTA